jgi:hypothetical protein
MKNFIHIETGYGNGFLKDHGSGESYSNIYGDGWGDGYGHNGNGSGNGYMFGDPWGNGFNVPYMSGCGWDYNESILYIKN